MLPIGQWYNTARKNKRKTNRKKKKIKKKHKTKNHFHKKGRVITYPKIKNEQKKNSIKYNHI